MKKTFNKKGVRLLILFTAAAAMITLFNIFIFPYIIKSSATSSKLVNASADELDIKKTNEILGSVIPKNVAIDNAEASLSKEKSISKCFDIENAEIFANYVYDNPILDQPLWIVIFKNTYNDYTYEFPKECVDKISESAWRAGVVWKDQDGNVFAYYDYYSEYQVVEIDATTGDYLGYIKLNAEAYDDEKNIAEWLKEKYNLSFDFLIS